MVCWDCSFRRGKNEFTCGFTGKRVLPATPCFFRNKPPLRAAAALIWGCFESLSDFFRRGVHR